LVSNVVTFLNAEKFMQEALESVLVQTYDNWELLLIDDGSTDTSTQIALRYAERFPEKVRYLEHPEHRNRGISASRNLGIAHAKGKYLGFLGADDVLMPRTLEQQVRILSSHPEAGMVYGSSLYWFGWTGNPKDKQRDFRDFVEECGVKPNTLIEPPELLRIFLRRDKGPCVFGSIPSPSSILVRSEVTRSVGGFDEEFWNLSEDRAFYVKVGIEAPVFAAGECWCKYRKHPEAVSYIAEKTNQQLPSRLLFLNWLAEYLFKRGIKDAEIWKLLHDRQLHAHNRQLKELERTLEKERRKVRRLRKRNQALILQAQDKNQHPQHRLSHKTRRLLKKIVHLRVRLLGR
jgi:glycosyltransferase involved in cell wall biosynthesis